MKLALITDTYHPQVNGVVSVVDAIAQDVGKECDVKILAPSGAGRNGVHAFRSFSFHPYPEYRIAAVGPSTVGRIFAEEGIDIVHVHTPFTLGLVGVAAAKRMGLPSVGTFHTMLPEYTHYVYGRIGFLLKGLTWRYVSCFYRRCSVVTTPSHPIKEALLRHGLKDVRVISNAVNVDTFCPRDAEPHADPVILFVGRLGKEKRIEVLINAAPLILERYHRARFMLVGTGVQETFYRKMVKAKGLSDSFIFRRYLSLPELITAYRECDIFVLPSDTETQGLVALEAMACGKPVVGADAGGLKEVVNHGVDGFRFPPGDSVRLAGYTLTLIDDEALRRRMGEEARKKAENFTSVKIARQWVDFYLSLLEAS